MVLTNKLIIVQSEDWTEFQKLYPRQASLMIRNYISNVINVANGDLTGVNIKLVQQDLAQKENLLNKTQSEVSELRLQIEKFSELQAGKEREQLERKKVQLEKEINLTKCYHCKSNIDTNIEFRGKAYKLCINCLNLFAPNVPTNFLAGASD